MLAEEVRVQMVNQFNIKVFSGVEIRGLCRTLEILHLNLGKRAL